MSVDWDEESREFRLHCDQLGLITWLDRRAQRWLSLLPGASLIGLAVDGSEAKLRAFLARAASGPVRDWEIVLRVGAEPATITCAALPAADGGIDLLGCVLPKAYDRSLHQLNAALGDALELSREISRQRNELTRKNEALTRAYRELDESHRGVRSLHAELAEKADSLRRSFELKSRIVSNVGHELRTPLHTILGFAQLLLTDAELGPEAERQVRFIRASAGELSVMVNDVLDLSKAESAGGALRVERFAASELFAALRGMLLPLASDAVALHFDAPDSALQFENDQGRLTQIMRNLITNALKFTERGEVRVSMTSDGEYARLVVRDTGIGIADADHELIFEEFGRVDNALQARVKGGGLGLPLSRKLARLLGGRLDVVSQLDQGSTFELALPLVHPGSRTLTQCEPATVAADDAKPTSRPEHAQSD